jgi:hypothetical protein
MPNNLSYVLTPQTGDRERIIENIQRYESFSREELIDTYNKAWKLGLVGVRAQAIAYFALARVFLNVFGKSPIKVEDKIILRLTDPIVAVGDSWEYIKSN